MKKVVLKIVGIAAIIVAILGSFIAGAEYGSHEMMKEANIASVKRRATYYTRLVQASVNRLDDEDRNDLEKVLSDDLGWFDARIDYRVTYIDENGKTHTGVMGNETIESFLIQLAKCEKIDVLAIRHV